MSKKTDTEIIIDALSNLSEELKRNGTISTDLISSESMANFKNRKAAELETQKKEAEVKSMAETKETILKGMGVKS